jgi:hypothetical protein
LYRFLWGWLALLAEKAVFLVFQKTYCPLRGMTPFSLGQCHASFLPKTMIDYGQIKRRGGDDRFRTPMGTKATSENPAATRLERIGFACPAARDPIGTAGHPQRTNARTESLCRQTKVNLSMNSRFGQYGTIRIDHIRA